MADKKKDKQVQDSVRKQLEDMLLSGDNIDEDAKSSLPIANNDDQGPVAKVQHPSTKSMDFYAVKDDIEQESKKLLKSVIEFYLDAKVIKRNEYLKYKQKVDEMTLSNIIFSLKTSQHAIIKLMEEIDMGNLHPRIFEVLAQLQNQMMVVVKHQAAYMMTLEEGYKKIKEDHDRVQLQRAMEEQTSDSIDKLDGSPVKVRGTKALMEGIQKDIKEDESKKDFSDYEEIKSRTNPKDRPDNPVDKDQPIKPIDEDTFDVDEDMY